MTSVSATRASQIRAAALAAACLGLWGCGPTDVRYDSGLAGLAVTDVGPEIVVPGSRLQVTGRSFVDRPFGRMRVRIEGTLTSYDTTEEVDTSLPLVFVDFDRAYVEVDEAALLALGGEEGVLAGEAWVEAESFVDDDIHRSERVPFELAIWEEIVPEIDSLRPDDLIFVNEPMEVEGKKLLLGEGEGETVAVVEGCFRPAGEDACESVGRTAVPVQARGDREHGVFAFSPAIAGIEPGVFEGQIALENRHEGGGEVRGEFQPVRYQLTEPVIFETSPSGASVGQYVRIRGGGFLGAGQGNTILEFRGEFQPEGGETVPVELLLIPELVDGRELRYVLAEDDSLGRRIDLRFETGTLSGTLEPATSYEGVEVRGEPVPFSLAIEPVEQVVRLRFLPSYAESLRKFGMRAVDAAIRERVVEVVERDYATINVEVRTEPVEDYALYATAEIAGRDPNGLELLGYDNTPGKDVGNERLYDRIGGVNAITQDDGYPGYGGVFIESLFQLSAEGGSALSDPAFDEIFDPFRPARGGDPIRSGDLEDGVPQPSSGEGCPAPEAGRREQIACAIWVLGSLIGTTVSHEIGHSLGLANPYGQGFHNPGNVENRLMNSGANRSFAERAELFGRGPGRFCDEEYAYLREILPTDEPADPTERPGCF